jgi:hypothetical protein
MFGTFSKIPNQYPCFKVCYPFKSLKYQCNLQEKTVWVHELVPMDLLNKVEEITMISLSILDNTNPVPLTICVLSPHAYVK